jgi:hypothetical protein
VADEAGDVIHRYILIGSEDHRSLYGVSQFSDIPGPGVQHGHSHGIIIKSKTVSFQLIV